ncbi:sarcosine oxidase subunit gamma [Streptomyces sp. TRM S81-3]|uniref:Sarcosine oxidase subunit gamma n=1 Tax=Streptomyces griseicoloratus TaxID=2752516 RepID=A0A926KYW5_9ACTN|nr:sarcosine oxidase subunit gamma family protein [Streptomyces griseicoloratus]MBD0419387.1 sarcosine oxidase subunit gamma [Streptomyces griseicoloratus]
MADTAARRSPLAHTADRFAAVTRSSRGALRLAELPFLAQVTVRLDPKSPAAEAAGLALGVPLPLVPNTVNRGGELAVLWLGPDEWLVVGPAATTGLAERLRTAIGDEHVTIADEHAAVVDEHTAVVDEHTAVVDVSAQRTTLLVAGPRSRDLLAHGCPIDLHPRAFGIGRCAQTTLARAHVVLVARDDLRPGFWVLVRSSFAGYLADWLLDAATEHVGQPALQVS